MTTKKSLNRIVAVAFAIILLASSGAQAGGLFSPNEGGAIERTTVFDQAANWMLDAWTGFASLFAFDSETLTPSTQSCTNPAGCGSDGDTGPGIDPEG